MASTPDAVRRSRTAIARQRLSMPARIALDGGIIHPDATVLDYGCGRGDDVRQMSALGIKVQGWDPHYLPEPAAAPADVVMLTYVLNVIEDIEERKETLRKALALARRCLVASIRLRWEEKGIRGTDHVDGIITSRSTFQALHRPEEFRLWATMVTGIRPVSPCPEVVYLFTDDRARADYVHRRYRRPSTEVGQALNPLNQLVAHLQTTGRPPRPDETPELVESLVATYGTVHRALVAAEQVLAPGAVAAAARQRKSDLVVALALDAFHGRSKFADLPAPMRADVKAFFGTYRDACRTADKLLVAAGQSHLVKRAMSSSRLGKLTPTALYVHTSALDHLVALLRIYEGCAQVVAGAPAGANLVKLHHDQPAVSYLTYPEFESDPHPRLATSLHVHIGDQRTRWMDYTEATNVRFSTAKRNS